MASKFRFDAKVVRELVDILSRSAGNDDVCRDVITDIEIYINRHRKPGAAAKKTPRASLKEVKKRAEALEHAFRESDMGAWTWMEIFFDRPSEAPTQSVTSDDGREPEIRLWTLYTHLGKLSAACDESLEHAGPAKRGPRTDHDRHRLAGVVACSFAVNGLPLKTSRHGPLERCIAVVLREFGYSLRKDLTTDDPYAGPARIVRETARRVRQVVENLRPGARALRRPQEFE